MKQFERQDIKWIIDKLDEIYHEVQLDNTGHVLYIKETIEDLGNAYHALQLENDLLKDSLNVRKAYYESVFQDGANMIKKISEENAKLRQDILQLEAMIED